MSDNCNSVTLRLDSEAIKDFKKYHRICIKDQEKALSFFEKEKEAAVLDRNSKKWYKRMFITTNECMLARKNYLPGDILERVNSYFALDLFNIACEGDSQYECLVGNGKIQAINTIINLINVAGKDDTSTTITLSEGVATVLYKFISAYKERESENESDEV